MRLSSPSRSRPGTRQGDAAVSEDALEAAAKVSLIRLALIDAGIAPSLAKVLREHYTGRGPNGGEGNPNVCEEAVAAVRNLCTGESSTCRDEMMRSEALRFTAAGFGIGRHVCVSTCLLYDA